MPNYCNYEMKIKGRKENVDKFASYVKADYSYDEIINENNDKEAVYKELTADKHFYRILEACIIDEEIFENGDSEVIISGYCAWSILSCMTDDFGSYYKKNEELVNHKGTHLVEATKELDVVVEIFSEEPGMGFMEHYLVDRGNMVVGECVDYEEEYDEETDECIYHGGIEWEYAI